MRLLKKNLTLELTSFYLLLLSPEIFLLKNNTFLLTFAKLFSPAFKDCNSKKFCTSKTLKENLTLQNSWSNRSAGLKEPRFHFKDSNFYRFIKSPSSQNFSTHEIRKTTSSMKTSLFYFKNALKIPHPEKLLGTNKSQNSLFKNLNKKKFSAPKEESGYSATWKIFKIRKIKKKQNKKKKKKKMVKSKKSKKLKK